MAPDRVPELLNPHHLRRNIAASHEDSNSSRDAENSSSSFPSLGPLLNTLVADERCSMASLPNEVLIKIAQSCQGHQKVATLRDLCKVSRRMDSVAREELYRAVTADTWPSLRRLCRTIEDHPALGQYIVDLELLVPGYTVLTEVANEPFVELDTVDLSMLYSLFLRILKETANLKTLTMILMGPRRGRGVRTGGPHQILYNEFTTALCQIIKQSQRGEGTPVVLPLLEQVRLGAGETWEDPTVYRRIGLSQPLVFLPFLHIPSMSSLESVEDSGVWPGSRYHASLDITAPSGYASHTHPYHQIKSVILRQSHCVPMDIMDICDIFPDMEVFFCQNRLKHTVHDVVDAQAVTVVQLRAPPPARRFLTHSLGQLQSLHTLALVPILTGFSPMFWKTLFSGPSGFLSLTGLPALTSLATIISVFASPDGERTGVLTASPMEVLPRSLRSLQIIVDHWTCRGLLTQRAPLNENWFQPREAALKFLSVLASICAREFPALRKVEYIWAVDRDIVNRVSMAEQMHQGFDPRTRSQMARRSLAINGERECDGCDPLCCDKHARIQALSPDEDYTSRDQGIVSPFKDRFDSLGAAFNEANVVFRIVELKEYSDFYAHWQGGRE